ncbi:hypothetical protein MTR67_023456 [Solanum verrucosum]|uniref:CCHC-type domain-containing protein n=1 Tax=Solanum verrucosum TaxID=315347 RepID=A0AAF0R117_SOLVR|nr:hypothetical protein MTR67_023456 [Solanum verrucosum]
MEIARSFSINLHPPEPSLASVPSARFQHDQKGKDGCFRCGQIVHRLKDCPSSKNRQGGTNSRAQSTTSVAPASRPTQHDTLSSTGGSQSQNRLYALHARQDQEDSPDVVNEISLDVSPKKLSEPFSVSTLVSDRVIAKLVYINCPLTVSRKVLSADIVKLEMVDFDIILGMDWLHSYYASVYCRTRIVRFQLPDEPFLKWNGSSSVPMGRFISYLKDIKMISKGYLYHLVRVKDSSSKTPTLE